MKFLKIGRFFVFGLNSKVLYSFVQFYYFLRLRIVSAKKIFNPIDSKKNLFSKKIFNSIDSKTSCDLYYLVQTSLPLNKPIDVINERNEMAKQKFWKIPEVENT